MANKMKKKKKRQQKNNFAAVGIRAHKPCLQSQALYPPDLYALPNIDSEAITLSSVP